MTKRWKFAVLLVWLGSLTVATAQPMSDPSRGELLYSMHCIACHSAEIHWREKKLATDWVGLKAQVSHWQGIAGLVWSDDDVAEVARYLNALHYHYPEHAQ
jgi:mono/diheme cytochrome c family protein